MGAALLEGAISKDIYAQINVSGLKVKQPEFIQDTDDGYPPPESEIVPELEPVPKPDPGPEPEPEPVQELAPAVESLMCYV